jgi:DNA-directed RNA polymerase specialized sigma24 family protein
MTIAAINTSDNFSQYVEQVYEKYYSRLQYYFLRQLGNLSEAEACVQDTIYRCFVFMQALRPEEQVDCMNVYLMRIASGLCLQKLVEKRWQRVDKFDEDNDQNSMFNKIRDESIKSMKERLQSERLFPGAERESARIH